MPTAGGGALRRSYKKAARIATRQRTMMIGV
jgi:hypothetical protein